MNMEVKQHTLHDLAQFLVDAGPYPNKDSCPWIKLATFGNLRSKKNSLRHNANVLSISGVEGDYDGEVMTPEEAIEALERHGIRAIVYTSPNNGVYAPPKYNGGPRWRVLAPLSKEYPTIARTALLARVNGALGGVLANESFTLSQSYYFGEVKGVQYRVYVTYNDPEEGNCVDELDELDDIAVTKEAKRHPNDDEDGLGYSIIMFEDAVADRGRLLRTGDGRRELLKQYIASRSGRGLLRDEVLMMVEGVVNRYFDPADPPDPDNLIELVNHFAERDGGTQPVDLSGFSLAATQETQQEPTRQAPVVVREAGLHEYPAPFPGLMAEICDAACAAAFKPQQRLNTLGAMIGLAASINGEYSTRSGGRFNLFGMGVLQSGGGKDMPRQMSEIVAACAKSSILGKPASGAGLEDSISDRKAALVSIDEMAHLVESINDERAPSHLRDIAAVLLKLYSASRGTYNRRVLSSGSALKIAPMVANPCLSVLGFATPDGLGAAFDERNLSDGLLGRMLFVQGEDGVTPRRPQSGFIIPQAVYDWAAQLRQIDPLASVAGPATNGSIVVGESHGIADTLDRLLVDMERNRSQSSVLASSLYARSYEKLERIAGVLAIMEDPQAPVLRAVHVEWARAFVLASDDHLLAFARERMNQRPVLVNADKLRAAISRIVGGKVKPARDYEADAIAAGFVARSQLLRVSKMDKTEFDRALMQLHDLDELEAFDDKGKTLKFIGKLAVTNK